MLRAKGRTLDFFLFSYTIKEATKRTDFLAAFSTDHSPIFLVKQDYSETAHCPGF